MIGNEARTGEFGMVCNQGWDWKVCGYMAERLDDLMFPKVCCCLIFLFLLLHLDEITILLQIP